nr:glucose-1-phosphate thymidylyltransferase RfbA [uncultured Romboutsia sp.]
MKGILLAGGFGTRLHPLTNAMSKQALPIYDKPMIYYPLSVLMLAGIRDILIISTKRDIKVFKEMFGDGSQLGLNLSYKIQDYPNGIAECFLLAEDFIDNDNVCLILGDNIFYGHDFVKLLKNAMENKSGATIFGYHVSNPSDFGVVEFDDDNNVLSIQEKPKNPKSNYVVPGLYFYDKDVCEIAKNIKPSPRGELEISDINLEYLKRKKLKVELMGRGIAWLDTGTTKGILDAANFVYAIQSRQGLYIACLEEIAYKNGYISKEDLLILSKSLLKTDYGKYIEKFALS